MLNGTDEVAYISRYIVQAIMPDVFLSRDFKEKLIDTIAAGETQFVYTDDNADDSAAAKTEKKADKKADNGQAERIIALLGGRENIVLVDACMTRLRVTVKDPAKVADLAAWKAEGALSLLVKGDGIQAVYGPKADVLKSDINDIL